MVLCLYTYMDERISGDKLTLYIFISIMSL